MDKLMSDVFSDYNQANLDLRNIKTIIERYGDNIVAEGGNRHALLHIVESLSRISALRICELSEKINDYIDEKYDRDELADKIIELIDNGKIVISDKDKELLEVKTKDMQECINDYHNITQMRDRYDYDGTINVKSLIRILEKYAANNIHRHIVVVLKTHPDLDAGIQMAFEFLSSRLDHYSRWQMTSHIHFIPDHRLINLTDPESREPLAKDVIHIYDLIVKGDL